MMGIKSKIKEIIKNNNRLYAMAYCVKELDDPNFIRLIKGYYSFNHDYCSILVKHNGEKYPDLTFFYIKRSVSEKNRKKGVRDLGGFCAVLRWSLELLNIADRFKLSPVIEWDNTMLYYDPDMSSVTENVFEYYFKPVSEIDYREIEDCTNVVEANMWLGDYLMGCGSQKAYEVEYSKIENLGYLYKKYIHLNESTKKYIEENVKSIIGQGAILAVHVRGTDFALGYRNHPVLVSIEEYISNTNKLFENGQYDKIFLATEDESVLRIFQQKFKGNLLYYSDVFRTQGHIGPHVAHGERKLHYYRLGLEVLRDIYTLANCDALICGLSQVSIAAQYVNISLNRRFKKLMVLNHGIHTEHIDIENK